MISKCFSYIRKRGLLIFLFKGPSILFGMIYSQFITLLYSYHLSSYGERLFIHHSCYIQNPNLISIGDDVRIGRGTIFKSESSASRLVIGSHVRINDNVVIDYTGNIVIGSNVTISEGAAIYSHSHYLDPRSKPIGFDKIIGDFVWIGLRALIMEKCRRIGDGSIIGSASLLLKDVDAKTIVVGNPARVIKHI
jgi:acetyltransferase-like isoleucine patch superfamily enzyme